MKDSQAQDSLISPLPTSLFSLIVLDAPYTERYVRCGERTGANHSLLLDSVRKLVYLTEPVMPSANCFCSTKKMMIVGSEQKRTPSISMP